MTHGEMEKSLFDILQQMNQPEHKTVEEQAADVKRDIFAEFERLGGGTSGS